MTSPSPIAVCPDCGTPVPPTALSCPSCRRLTHGDELRRLAAEARMAHARGDMTEELRIWRESLSLLPRDTAQYHTIEKRLSELSQKIDDGLHRRRTVPSWLKKLGPLAPLLLLLWKFKAVLVLVLTKGKLLLMGLTKFSTLSSMILSLGAYWTLYGWPFALGIILSIYVHEMGHVYALRQFGIPASAPMFVPFMGAFVRSKALIESPRESARVGLAGPIWGTSAAMATFVLYWLTAEPVLGAVAHFGAWINLLNLLPVFILDGGRAFGALTRSHRLLILGLALVMWAATGEGFLAVLAAVVGFRLFTRDAPDSGDTKTLLEYCGLVVVLALLLDIPVPKAPIGQ